MKKLKTPKEVFLYLSKIYEKCKSIDDCYENGIDEYICVSIYKICNGKFGQKCVDILEENKPKGSHWATRTDLWAGTTVWWLIYGNDINLTQVFQDKSRFLKELSDSL